ncbi:MAG: 2-succinyl-5-enolpyruvyl-6-hydroxy-3-cyclohexene-1-carboxylic-acid synthase [Gemmatimonadales bacterium]|nr:MAG: 2-succinyl-5-enolpyruvyl-6-hydroxy-3-cyclohexene-1-carboxylic-acid synthase [Gemmatimonadales bacterium]
MAALCRRRNRRGLRPGARVGGDGAQVRARAPSPPGRSGRAVTDEAAGSRDASVRRANERWATVLIDELARAGLRVVVVAPGSRSSPLVFAAARHPEIRTLVQLDERSAGFLALGVGKATGRPAAVITTSGTAVANLLPAVVEASQSEAPLLLLTADRPPRLRGTDANQAIDQPGIFGGYTRHAQELSPAGLDDRTLRHLRASAARAMSEAIGDPGGPVHLNLPFEKPLEPGRDGFDGSGGRADGPEAGPTSAPDPLAETGRARSDARPWTVTEPRRALPSEDALATLGAELERARRPLLIAGRLPHPESAGPALVSLARTLGVPLLADALSGARFEPRGGAIGGYDLALGSSALRERLRPDLVLRFGASPTSARLLAVLEELHEVPGVVVDGGGRWKDHLGAAGRMLHGDPTRVAQALETAWTRRATRPHSSAPGTAPTHDPASAHGSAPGAVATSGWLDAWRRVDLRVGELAEKGLHEHPCEGSVLAEVVRRVPEDEVLFVSSSMPIRDLDAFGLPSLRADRSRPLLVLGNRGASGIDGIVSTAIGAGVGRGRPVTAVVGDLALIHDMNGLVALQASRVRLTLVVINNDGGGIFHLLPVREMEPEFTRFFATPHGLEPGRVAALHGLRHRRVSLVTEATERRAGIADLRDALDEAHGGTTSTLIEVRTDREMNRRARTEVFDAVRHGLESGGRLDETA